MAAEYASSRCYEFMPTVQGALAERILVLEMLTYRLGSLISASLRIHLKKILRIFIKDF